MAHEVVDRSSAETLLLQHGLNDAPKFVREVNRDAFVLTFFDLKGKSELVLSLERWSECRHFISQAAQAPYVALLIVLLLVDLLRAHVVRCANVGLSIHRTIVKHSG